MGPPDMGNGGYVSGVLAEHLEGTAEITLRLPTPLEQALSLRHDTGGKRVVLENGDKLIAEGRATSLQLTPPAPFSYEEAVVASQKYAGFVKHPFPDCFVCGTTRSQGDGLRIFPGPLNGPFEIMVAAGWIPDKSLGNASGLVQSRFIWAALDCPGGFAAIKDGKPTVLGQMTARIENLVRVGERYSVVGWLLAEEGRKRTVGSAIFSEAGLLCGIAKGIWFELTPKIHMN